MVDHKNHSPGIGGKGDQPGNWIRFSRCTCLYFAPGWLREWDDRVTIQPSPFPVIKNPFLENSSAFLSDEDLGFNRSSLDYLCSLFPLLVLTKGKYRAEFYWQDKIKSISDNPGKVVDPTGAGEIFAAAFMKYFVIEKKSIEKSARLASALAAISVTRPGIEGIPTELEIQSIQKVQ
jgi:hypothetical protein